MRSACRPPGDGETVRLPAAQINGRRQTPKRYSIMLVQSFAEVRSFVGSGGALSRSGHSQTPVAFLDRDGVINANRDSHVRSWDDFEFLPGALDAIAVLTRSGWRIVVVTNQAIINRGQITATELGQLHQRMADVVREHGGQLSAVYACPHRPDEGCRCRKPEPGLVIAAADQHNAELERSYLIGDHVTDVEAARRAGCRSILVLCGRHREFDGETVPDTCVAVVPDLLAAAHWIVQADAERPKDADRKGATAC